jgi:hypothetical protein
MDRDPVRIRHELTQLIQQQINTIEEECFGGATDVEHREYEARQRRIDELYDEFQRLNTAA